MLAAVNAKIINVGKKRINVEINNYFYWINVSEKNQFQVSNQVQKIYCKQIMQLVNNEIKTDLYGFETIKELEWFQTLMNCQGIGPKTAIKLMVHNIDKMKELIWKKDKMALAKLEGININVANYLAYHNWKPWELNKNNLVKENKKTFELSSNDRNEIVSTLVVLGYEENKIIEMLEQLKLDQTYEVSDIIATLIKLMANNENEHQLSAQ